MKILAIYDNEGETLDRYTVYLAHIETIQDNKPLFLCFCMDESTKAIAMHSTGMLGAHNGKRISKKDLPLSCKNKLSTMNYK